MAAKEAVDKVLPAEDRNFSAPDARSGVFLQRPVTLVELDLPDAGQDAGNGFEPAANHCRDGLSADVRGAYEQPIVFMHSGTIEFAPTTTDTCQGTRDGWYSQAYRRAERRNMAPVTQSPPNSSSGKALAQLPLTGKRRVVVLWLKKLSSNFS